jgi:hypothetical protein
VIVTGSLFYGQGGIQMDHIRKSATAHVAKGLTCKGYIHALRYVHGPVKFVYAVIPPEFRSRYFKTLAKQPEDGQSKYQADFISGLITEWNQTYSQPLPNAGEPLPRDGKSFLGLDPGVQSRITNIIFRASESDLDPDDPIEQLEDMPEFEDQTADDLLKEMAGKHDEQVGNSSAL